MCIEDACVLCSNAVDVSPDEACADLDTSTPLCIEDACVACTAEDIGSCGDMTPVCDAESSTCLACQFHEQFQEIGSLACNIATGACFDPANVTEVDASSATVELHYSSVLGGTGDADGFVCTSGINIRIRIRNAIITTRGATAALGCAGADVSNTAVEDSGVTSWLADYNGFDAHLEAAGQAQFMGTAEWSPGDPPFDFDGDLRPGPGNLPGADVP